MTTLICDLNITHKGHNASYIQYIVDHISEKEGERIFFLFNKSARAIVNFTNAILPLDHFYFSLEDYGEDTLYDKLKFGDWKVIEKYSELLKIDKLFIMELTRYEVQIGTSKVPYKISGIEFRPSHRIQTSNARLSTRVKAITKKYKKLFFEALLLRCKSVQDVFILNDPAGVNSLNKLHRTKVFKHLIDPVYDYKPVDSSSIQHLPTVDKKKVVYLIFGAISWRKNIRNILDAFGRTERKLHPSITLMIVGRVPVSFSKEFRIMIDNFSAINSEIELIVVDDFVSNSQMEYFFSISHVSLLVYASFFGSSALLGRAAKYNVTSLVPNVGLMAEICKEYRLGYPCDPDSPEDIKDKITTVYHDIRTGNRIDGAAYYISHSPERFLEMLNF